MPGSIRRRGDSYVLRLYAGSADGKKVWKWLTFATRAEAEAAQRELASHTLAHAAGTGIFGSPRERLGPYLTDWLERQTHLAPKTRVWYDTVIAQVRRDALGTVPLAKLTPRAFEGYYTRVLAKGRSSTTVLHHHRLLHTALRDAERQDLILKNPVATARAPRRAKVRLEVWTEAQTLLFLSEARTRSPYAPLYLFLVGTGTRIGEALGLAWPNVRWDDSAVVIDRELAWLRGGGFVLKEPKTERSRRSIDIGPEVLAELRALREWQATTRARRLGQNGLCEQGAACSRRQCPRWHDLGLVFCQPNGKPAHVHNFRLRDLQPLCRRLGLPYRRAIHNLRHAHGSYLLQRGVSVKVVQERLGHASAQFTLGTYAHVLAGMQAHAAQAISAMLAGTDAARGASPWTRPELHLPCTSLGDG